MTREEQTTVAVTCDGCGTTTQAPSPTASRWRALRVTSNFVSVAGASRMEGNERELDLCSDCVDKIKIPGLNKPTI